MGSLQIARPEIKRVKKKRRRLRMDRIRHNIGYVDQRTVTLVGKLELGFVFGTELTLVCEICTR